LVKEEEDRREEKRREEKRREEKRREEKRREEKRRVNKQFALSPHLELSFSHPGPPCSMLSVEKTLAHAALVYVRSNQKKEGHEEVSSLSISRFSCLFSSVTLPPMAVLSAGMSHAV
jgi:hypothetical protein